MLPIFVWGAAGATPWPAQNEACVAVLHISFSPTSGSKKEKKRENVENAASRYPPIRMSGVLIHRANAKLIRSQRLPASITSSSRDAS